MPSLQGAPPDQAVRFEIVDEFYDVASDGLGEYVDHRLLTNPADASDVNHCVETSITGGGFAFLALNRQIDGKRCDDETGAGMRSYLLFVDSATACAELVANRAATWVSQDDTCEMNGNRSPRIRVDRLKANASSTTIDFLIGRPANWTNELTYEVQSVGEAMITPIGDTLQLDYNGLFRLARFGLPRTKGKPQDPPETTFNMSLRMRFIVERF
jgi:hypothetical protein